MIKFGVDMCSALRRENRFQIRNTKGAHNMKLNNTGGVFRKF
jgi:hypothetical protein